MIKYHIKIEYDGTKFVGWQYQKNGISVQEVIQNVFFKVLKEKILVNGAGRTDTGVHAIEQSAHIDLKNKILNKNIFLNSVNFYLKEYYVCIKDIKKNNINFHARHSAIKRVYKYVIINRFSPLVFDQGKAWHVKKKLDIKLMKKASKLLVGTHDFSTFRSASCGAKSPIKTLNIVSIIKSNEKIIIKFVSKSFLQQQVRSMVGCLKYLGEGKWTISDFKNIFLSKKRSLCAAPAPPQGLYLYKVFY